MFDTARAFVLALGGPGTVAQAIGCKPSNVRMWISSGLIPSKHHTAIVLLAERQRVAGIDHFALSSLGASAESKPAAAAHNVKKLGGRKGESVPRRQRAQP